MLSDTEDLALLINAYFGCCSTLISSCVILLEYPAYGQIKFEFAFFN